MVAVLLRSAQSEGREAHRYGARFARRNVGFPGKTNELAQRSTRRADLKKLRL